MLLLLLFLHPLRGYSVVVLVWRNGVVLPLLLSGTIRRAVLSELLVSLLPGVLLGPFAIGLLDPAGWGSQVDDTAASGAPDACHLAHGSGPAPPKGRVLPRLEITALFLKLVTPLMWLASGLLVYLILGLPFLMASGRYALRRLARSLADVFSIIPSAN